MKLREISTASEQDDMKKGRKSEQMIKDVRDQYKEYLSFIDL
jgi:hypothetical protein